MTAQFYFHLATNVTITPMSATFTALPFMLDMLENGKINSGTKNGGGDYLEMCVAAGIKLK